MAAKAPVARDEKRSVNLILKVRTAGKILEETVLHPRKTSRIVIDSDKETVTVHPER
jgi:hypothetical protein